MNTELQMIELEGKIDFDTHINCLIDTGACTNHLSSTLARRRNPYTTICSKEVEIELADSNRVKSNEIAEVKLTLDQVISIIFKINIQILEGRPVK